MRKTILYTIFTIILLVSFSGNVSASDYAEATCVYETATHKLTYKLTSNENGVPSMEISTKLKDEKNSVLDYTINQNVSVANFVSEKDDKFVCLNQLYYSIKGGGTKAVIDVFTTSSETANQKASIVTNNNNNKKFASATGESISCSYTSQKALSTDPTATATIAVNNGVLGTPILSSNYSIGNNSLTIDDFYDQNQKLYCPTITFMCGGSGGTVYCSFSKASTVPGADSTGGETSNADEISGNTNNDNAVVLECGIFGENVSNILETALLAIKVLAPILIIILGIIDFLKALASGDDKTFKESGKRFIKRLIAGIIIIFLPSLIEFLINISGLLEQYGISKVFC